MMVKREPIKHILLAGTMCFVLFASEEESRYVEWASHSESQIQRLQDAIIMFEVRDGTIWIKEKDVTKAVMCCT
ncbi:hypothetical protein JSY36_17825 [Bacillus sp. H-16]|uniref:hypothetical protein n=1 Tax=Alteribacter salitolerans TaxID=2912333 RepID=UPI0019659D5A|nr:hypothetical protein [Alteribacter salitolerans]MBM7097596.1 hypothetical protein [Alteribacter salitolerans]